MKRFASQTTSICAYEGAGPGRREFFLCPLLQTPHTLTLRQMSRVTIDGVSLTKCSLRAGLSDMPAYCRTMHICTCETAVEAGGREENDSHGPCNPAATHTGNYVRCVWGTPITAYVSNFVLARTYLVTALGKTK